ncbi:HI1506-related protein [Ectopseudomonas oleovorans]|uniref:HI1506-related protein n=1 Tax=Ectopseudomonas oleovorans TaxID=301 RepID=UPI0035B421DE
MANKSTAKAPAKAPTKSADKAAPAAAPAAAEQLATQPAAPTENAAPAQVTGPASTEQPTESVPAQAGDMAGNGPGVTTGQEAHPDTTPAAPDAPAATSQPASAAPQAQLGDAVVTQPGAEAQAAASPAGGSATDAVDGLGDDGDYEGLWVEAIPEQGFRRCGFRFTREGFGIALSALTAEQIEQLENEPNLKVERGIFSGSVGERAE